MSAGGRAGVTLLESVLASTFLTVGLLALVGWRLSTDRMLTRAERGEVRLAAVSALADSLAAVVEPGAGERPTADGILRWEPSASEVLIEWLPGEEGGRPFRLRVRRP